MNSTKITEVSVYRSACLVKRSAVVLLTEEPQKVIFSGLSDSADQSSLRLAVPSGVRAGNVQMENLTEEEKEAALKDKRAELAKLKARISLKEKQLELWLKNADFTKNEKISLPEMTDFIESLPERLLMLSEETDALRAEAEAKEKALEKEEKKLDLPIVTALLSAEKAGGYPIELTVKDHAASWYPSYEIHTQEEGDSLLLRHRAVIRQNTEEDWNGVRLTLYSGDPSVSGTIPTLFPQHVSLYQPVRPQAMAKGARMLAATVAEEETVMLDSDTVFAGMMNTVTVGSAQRLQAETMTEYAVNGCWDVKSGRDIVVDLDEKSLPCRYHVVTVPKRSGSAYLAAEVDAALLEDLQNTEAAVYLKDVYAGDVFLNPDLTKEKYDLPLGVDDTVKVRRDRKKNYTSQQLLKGTKKTEYEYEIAVSSRKQKLCSVTVMDQLPLSDDKSITVETGELSGGVREEDTGLITWNFELVPGETRRLMLSYSVTWPKDKQLSGL